MPSNYASSLVALANYLDVSPATLQKWELMAGFPIKGPDGFHVESVARWAVNNAEIKKNMRNKVSASTGLESSLVVDDLEDDFSSVSGSPNLERYRKARAEQEELKLAVQKNELVKLADYIQAEATRYAIFKRSLEGLTNSLPPRLQNLTPDEMRKELQRSFDELLKSLQREIQ